MNRRVISPPHLRSGSRKTSGAANSRATPPHNHIFHPPLWTILILTILISIPGSPAAPQIAALQQDVTKIDIRGIDSANAAMIHELVGGRLTFARNKPPTPALADDAAFMVRLALNNHGYPKAKVTPSIQGNRITLNVDSGAHIWLGSVLIPGFEDKESVRLARLFSSTGEKRKLAGESKTPFRESDVDPGLEMLRNDFKSRGYWDATAEVRKQSTDPATGEVKFIIDAKPGPLHTISQPRFSGETQGLDSVLKATTDPFVGRPATTTNVNQLRSAVESAYLNRGFENASIQMSADPAGSGFATEFTLDAGIRYRSGKLDVVGLDRTRESAIQRFRRGLDSEYYDAEAIDRRIRALLSTGAFSAVQFETTPRGDILDGTLRLEEGKARGTSYYAGYGTYEGGIFGARYYDRNFGGHLWNLASGFEISQRTLLGELGLTIPWFGGSGSRLGGRIFSLGRSHEGYDKQETGLSIQYVRELAKDAPLTVFFGASYVNIDTTGIPPAYLGPASYTHTRLRVTQEWDRRDDPLSPSRGWRFFGAIEIGSAIGDENVPYTAIEAGLSWHTPIAEAHQLSLGLRGGSIYSGDKEIPIDLRYFLGGPDSIRSYTERDMPPRTRYNYPAGGEAYWVFNAEYAHHIAGPLKAVVFADAAGLSTDFSNFGFDDTDAAAGLGLRLDLPIGPVRLEYGHNLTKDDNEPSGSFHFAIGVAF